MSSLIRIYAVCHSVYIFWRHYCIVKSNCFILRTTTVVSLDVPTLRVFTVVPSGFSLFISYQVMGTSLYTSAMSAKGWLVVFLFKVHGKHLWSCRDGQLT